MLRNFAAVAPRGREPFKAAMRSVLGEKLHVGELIEGALGTRRPVCYVDHHISHAASAFYPSPFESAAVLTIDGVGEHATLTIGHGRDNKVELLREIRYPHSLGLLYSAITHYCGFRVNSGEYKLMGLAPYGEPRFADLIRKHLIDVKEDGSFALDLDYFAFMEGAAMSGEKLHALFGQPPRTPESRIELFHMDVAASIQAVTEEIMLKLARTGAATHRRAQSRNGWRRCAELRRQRQDPALGHHRRTVDPAGRRRRGPARWARLSMPRTWASALPRKRSPSGRDTQHGSYLGPAHSSAQVRAFLDRAGFPTPASPTAPSARASWPRRWRPARWSA